jgi:FMN reductase
MKAADLVVLSTSLNTESRSRILAKHAYEYLSKTTAGNVEWIDLQNYELPLCDGGAAYKHANVTILSEKLSAAKCILVATPIYNFDVNAALKNLIELTGNSWSEKLIGFICAAGGKSSYMSVMAVANSLMLDFRSIIIPRFVYTDGDGFDADAPSSSIAARLEQLCDESVKLCHMLHPKVTV